MVLTMKRPKEEPTCTNCKAIFFSFRFLKAKCGPFIRGPQLGWRGLWRPARSEQVEALQQVQARSVRIRRALRGDSPRAPQPQGAETPCAPPADASRSGENARSRVASSLAPSLNSGVLHLLRPGCGLLNHRPKIRAAARAELGLSSRQRSSGKGAQRAGRQCPVRAEPAR